MSLSSGKKTVQGSGKGLISAGVKAAATLFQGGLTMLSSGYAIAATAAPAGTDFQKMGAVSLYRLIGVAQASVTGGGADGAVPVDVQAGDWLCKNSSGADAITVANVGHYCFVVDDETVAKTSASNTRPRAGVVVAVDATGVMVRIAPEIAAAAERVIFLPYVIPATELAAGTPIELVSPRSGTIIRNTTVVQTLIVTGGDITVNVGVTAVAGLTNTIADAAAKGGVVTDTPTAGDATAAVAAGDRLSIVPAAAFNGGGAINGILEIGY